MKDCDRTVEDCDGTGDYSEKTGNHWDGTVGAGMGQWIIVKGNKTL